VRVEERVEVVEHRDPVLEVTLMRERRGERRGAEVSGAEGGEKEEKRRVGSRGNAAGGKRSRARARGRRRTFPNVHWKGGNTAPSWKLGVATISSTFALTLTGCRSIEHAGDERDGVRS
jgi:hypothetical protein